jgi:pSer/pThr/pTyr-binding forkhead associated (FHA) protein
MDPDEKGALDRMESFARRVLERLGTTLDRNVVSKESRPFNPDQLLALLEQEVESNLREDAGGIRRVSPNLFCIKLPYEAGAKLSDAARETVRDELQLALTEHIDNRRYQTTGKPTVEIRTDVFARAIGVDSSFTGDESPRESPSAGRIARQATGQSGERNISLRSGDGTTNTLRLRRGEPPVYLGRAAGTVVRIDDPSISRFHCSFTVRDDGELVVADLGSSNGTAVNGRVLDPDHACPLKDGDSLRVGDVGLRVEETNDV